MAGDMSLEAALQALVSRLGQDSLVDVLGFKLVASCSKVCLVPVYGRVAGICRAYSHRRSDAL